MPAAAIPIIGAVAGAGGSAASAAGGKKAQNKANQLAQQQLGLEQGMFTKASNIINPARDWLKNLLQGGQAAVQATGPYASLIGQAGQGTRSAILASTPRGGEQNLALAQNQMNVGNNIARLYAGMQPLAVQGLTDIGKAYLGSGQSLAYPATSAGLGAAQMGMQNAASGAAGFGSLLYNSLNKLRGGKGKGGSLGGKVPATS